ncbi:uncharacterized protein LOC119676450 [Teleopsis dalmanni]|uniref:uncharacterized protein LOC119676450 n=1 Tax=Teleopsis dalmanni TaxID=139649 RepID=UPI0018CE3461|nr:uncharacterized protein LOC119676450 [Teleopsis dalmanni]
MDKDEYDQRVQEKIDNGPYREFRINPLPEMVNRTNKLVEKCSKFLDFDKKQMKEPAPSLPRFKALPKIHKPGKEMREIITADRSPCQRIAKWLVKELTCILGSSHSLSVKNSKEFAEKLKLENITGDEETVSFDVKALYPSVNVKEAIRILEEELLKNKVNKIKIMNYIQLTQLCMEENYFTFRGRFFKQTKGAPMGNPLSSLLSELFMSRIESSLKEKNYLPRVWIRYVDDVFAIIRKNKLQETLENLNSAHRNIEFTHERENNGYLPFLDILTQHKNGIFEFSIYRKPTSTKRVITNNSNHSFQHKMAAFHHMIHRMLTLPLTQAAINEETTYIKEVADINGYPQNTIDRIIKKKRRQLHSRNMTTLTAEKPKQRRVAVVYNNTVSKGLKSKLKKFNIDLVHSSRPHQLECRLPSAKDPIDPFEKCGVYKIECGSCNKVYIGQTKRPLSVRLEEHLKEAREAPKKMNPHIKSNVARHIVKENHHINKENAQIIKNVRDSWKLETAESIEIHKYQTTTLLNGDKGNVSWCLFRYIPKNRQPVDLTTCM